MKSTRTDRLYYLTRQKADVVLHFVLHPGCGEFEVPDEPNGRMDCPGCGRKRMPVRSHHPEPTPRGNKRPKRRFA